MSLNMTMKTFLQHMIWRGPDNVPQDRQNATTSNNQGNPETLETGPQPSRDVPKKTDRTPRRPSSLSLFANTKNHQNNHRHYEPKANEESLNCKSPTSRVIEEAVKEFGESYKSPTKTPTKKSLSFVKRLVAALERKQRSEGEVEDDSACVYDEGPIMAYEMTGTIRKPKTRQTRKDDLSDEFVKEKTAPSEPVVKTKPKIVGAFLKKPIEIDETPIYWIPIIGMKLPRKKSFKKLLAKLTGRTDGKRNKSKLVVFASQDKLIDEIHDSGYEERSTSTSSRTSSLASFTETLMNQDNDYLGSAYSNCTFSTFLTSSPIKIDKPADSRGPRLRLVEVEPAVLEAFREDSGYVSSYSISDESGQEKGLVAKRVHKISDECSLEKGLVAKRVRQISDQFANLPKHPFVRSEPRLHGEYFYQDHLSGEIVELRRRKEEPIYDVPRPRPQSSILEESLSVRRRNAHVHSVEPLVRNAFPIFYGTRDDEEFHYATIKPRCAANRVSLEKLSWSLPEVSEREDIDKRYSSWSSADLTANSSFVITMYV